MTRRIPTNAGSSAGLHALNEANDATRLDRLLHQYFRLGMPAASASTSTARNQRKRRFGASASASTDPYTTNDGELTPERALKQLKAFLKDTKDDKHMRRVVDAVQSQLHKAKKHKPLLPLVVTLCSELFTRSAAFRALIASQTAGFYQQLLEGAGEKDYAIKRRRLPSSAGNTKHQSQSAEVDLVLGLIESWRDAFGAKYPTIVAGYAGLQEKGYVFPCVRERNQQRQRDAVTQQQQREALRKVRIRTMEKEMPTSVAEMEMLLVEMDSVFEILVPTLDAFEVEMEEQEKRILGQRTGEKRKEEEEEKTEENMSEDDEEEDDGVEWEQVAEEEGTKKTEDDDDDGVEWEDVVEELERGDQEEEGDEEEEDEEPLDTMDINDIVQAYGLGSSSYQLTISISTTLCEKSNENEVLFRTLTDGVLQIRKRFLPLVRDWLHIADAESVVAAGEQRDLALVRRLQQLQTRLESATLKWEDLVKESDRKRFAHVQPRVVSLPILESRRESVDSKPMAKKRPRTANSSAVL